MFESDTNKWNKHLYKNEPQNLKFIVLIGILKKIDEILHGFDLVIFRTGQFG